MLYNFTGTAVFLDAEESARERNGNALLDILKGIDPARVISEGIDYKTAVNFFEYIGEEDTGNSDHEGYVGDSQSSTPHCVCLHKVRYYHWVMCAWNREEYAMGSECIKAVTGQDHSGIAWWVSSLENYILKQKTHKYSLSTYDRSNKDVLLMPAPSQKVYDSQLKSLPDADQAIISELLRKRSRTFFQLNLSKIPLIIMRERFLVSLYMMPIYAGLRKHEAEVLDKFEKLEKFFEDGKNMGFIIWFWQKPLRLWFSNNRAGFSRFTLVKLTKNGKINNYLRATGPMVAFDDFDAGKGELRVWDSEQSYTKDSTVFKKMRLIAKRLYTNMGDIIL